MNSKQKGFADLLPLIFFVVVVAAAFYYFKTYGDFSTPAITPVSNPDILP